MNEATEETVFATTDDYKRYLATVLMGLGATHASVPYDGQGDSGAFDEVIVYDGVGGTINIRDVKVRTPHEDDHTLKDALTSMANDCLDSNNIDWYNNDGGFGEYLIDLRTVPFTFTLKHNHRITSVEYESYNDFGEGGE